MALIKGTNCGFLTSAPAAEPSGDSFGPADGKAWAMLDSLPAGNWKVTQLGWFSEGGYAVNYDLGIYTDAGASEPEAVISKSGSSGTSSWGWKTVSVDIDLTGSTNYWLAFQIDNTGNIYIRRENTGSSSAQLDSQSSLPSNWGTSSYKASHLLGVYALIEEVSAPAVQINIVDTWKDIEGVQINIGDTWKEVAAIKQNIGDSWKAV